MTQFNATPPPPVPYSTQGDQPQTNGLATAALICSLILCVPFLAPALGAILGLIAVVMIAQSKGKQRGVGMAIAGIVISCAVFVGDIWGAKYVGRKIGGAVTAVFAMYTQPAEDLIKHLEADDYPAARSLLSPKLAAATTDEELARFKQRIADSCGSLVEVNVDFNGHAYVMGLPAPAGWNPNAPNAPATQPQTADLDSPLEFVFEDVTYYGAVWLKDSASKNPNPNFGTLFKLEKLAIVTEDGIIYFPEEAGN